MCRILVADDDPVQLGLRKLMLESAGHEVSLAFTANQAIRHVRNSATDLVILDLRFPNAEGVPDTREGLALIRRIREACPAPIILLSGWTADLEGQPEERMVHRVLLKPVKPSLLMKTIRELEPV